MNKHDAGLKLIELHPTRADDTVDLHLAPRLTGVTRWAASQIGRGLFLAGVLGAVACSKAPDDSIGAGTWAVGDSGGSSGGTSGGASGGTSGGASGGTSGGASGGTSGGSSGGASCGVSGVTANDCTDFSGPVVWAPTTAPNEDGTYPSGTGFVLESLPDPADLCYIPLNPDNPSENVCETVTCTTDNEGVQQLGLACPGDAQPDGPIVLFPPDGMAACASGAHVNDSAPCDTNESGGSG